MSKEAMKLDKDDIETAKGMALTMQKCQTPELVVVGNLLAKLLAERREPLTDAAYYNACLSYRHDFGLMSDEDRQKLVFEAKEWARAFGITKGNT